MPTTKKNIICGLDIGTSKIATVLGKKNESSEIEILGLGLARSSGLRKGMITDIEETISAISASLEEAERMAGFPIENCNVAVGGAHIQASNSKGVIAVSRADGEILEDDVGRAIEAAKAVSIPTNREILHVIPSSYTVDGQEGIKDPLGMTGIRLEVDTHVISSSTPCIKNLTKCVYHTGLDISDMVFSGLATSGAFLSRQQKEIGVIIADIGAVTTTITVFEEGNLVHSAVLPIGSSHITNDIGIGLRTSIDTAEQIKIKYGNAIPENIKKTEDEIDLSKFDKSETQKASTIYVAEIIEARLEEIFTLIQDDLKSISRDGTLPAGIILVGGGSKLPGITEVAKEILQLPASIGKLASNYSGLVDRLDTPVYACGIGLMLWGLKVEKKGSTIDLAKNFQQTTGRIKSWVKKFLP